MTKFVVQLKCKCLHFFVHSILLNKNLKIFNRREKIFDLKNIINRSKNYEGLVDYGQVRNFLLKLVKVKAVKEIGNPQIEDRPLWKTAAMDFFKFSIEYQNLLINCRWASRWKIIL